MRLAKVVTEICTFCFVLNKEEVAGPIPIPVTLSVLEGGGFTFYYDPTSTEEDSKAFACASHGEKVTTMLDKFKNDVQINIVDVVKREEEAPEDIEEGELPEGAEEFEDGLNKIVDGELPEDEEFDGGPEDALNAAALLAHMAAKTGAAGAKVTPATSNPKADQDDESWRAIFPEGYEPSKEGPKGTEKKACEEWFKGLTLNVRRELTNGRGTFPTRRPDAPLVYAWHRSEAKAEYMAQAAAMMNA